MNLQIHELVNREVAESHGACLANKIGRDTVNSHRDQLINAWPVIPKILDFGHEVGADAMDAHGDELIRRDPSIAAVLQVPDKVRRYIVNPHRDESIR